VLAGIWPSAILQNTQSVIAYFLQSSPGIRWRAQAS
jgi:hypothetical protein